MSLCLGFSFIHISLGPDSFVLASSIDFYLIVGIPKNCLSAEVQEEGAMWGVYKKRLLSAVGVRVLFPPMFPGGGIQADWGVA